MPADDPTTGSASGATEGSTDAPAEEHHPGQCWCGATHPDHMMDWSRGACWCGKTGVHNVGMGRTDPCADQRRAVDAARERAQAAQAAHRDAAKQYWDERKSLNHDISTEIADQRSYEEANERLSDEIFERQKAIADVAVDTTPTVTVHTDPPRTLPRSQETADALRAEIEKLDGDRKSNDVIITKKQDFIARQRKKRDDMDSYPEKYVDPSLRENREKAEEALKAAQKALDDCTSSR